MDLSVRWISILLFTAGCAAQARESAHSARVAPPAPRAEAKTHENAEAAGAESARSPAEQLDEADRLYGEQLGIASRDDRYVERQVAALVQAIRLYEEFISHAGNDAQFRDAVRRSRERIKDARETIDFLLLKEAPKP